MIKYPLCNRKKTTSIEVAHISVDSIRLDIIDEPFSEVQKIIEKDNLSIR